MPRGVRIVSPPDDQLKLTRPSARDLSAQGLWADRSRGPRVGQGIALLVIDPKRTSPWRS